MMNENAYFTSLENMKEIIYIDSGIRIIRYNLVFSNNDNIVLYYYDPVTLVLTILPASNYSIDNYNKIITITNNSFIIPDFFILTFKTTKKFTNLLADFSFPDFTFLESINPPIFDNTYFTNQLVPRYTVNGVPTLINSISNLYSLDIYNIGQNHSLLTGVNGESYASISVNPQYSVFFTWFNNTLIGANSLYIYYHDLITNLNTFVTNNTIAGLNKPTLANVNATSLALMGADYNTTLTNIVQPLYQYQVDYWNAVNSSLINNYSEANTAINTAYNFNWSFLDNGTPPINAIVRFNNYSPSLDSSSGRYDFGGINQDGITYNKVTDTAFQNSLSFSNWKYYADNGGSNSFLYYHLIVPSTTQTANVVATSNITLSGFQTIDSYAVTTNNIVIATNQTIASQNGPWVVASGNWIRPSWFTSGSISNYGGLNFIISNGSHSGTKWLLATDNSITVDTTNISIIQTSLLQDSALQIYAPKIITDNALTTPPSTANSSSFYIVPSGATGAWLGQTNNFAYTMNNGISWYFKTPATNQIVLIVSGTNSGNFYEYNGSSWSQISYVLSSDNNALSLGYQFDTFGTTAQQDYVWMTTKLDLIFADYATYVSSTYPITEANAIIGIENKDSATYNTVMGMINSIISIRSGTMPISWQQYSSTIQSPVAIQYSYYVVPTLSPFYLKNNQQITLLNNDTLFFGDYYNIVSNPEKYLIGANGEDYDTFIANFEYNPFTTYFTVLQNYINSNIAVLDYNLFYLLNFSVQENINFDLEYYKNSLIYNTANLSITIADLQLLFQVEFNTLDQINLLEELNRRLFDNIVAEYQNLLLSLKFHPFNIEEIDLRLPPIPTDYSTITNYALILRYDANRQLWVLDWGASIDNTTNSVNNGLLFKLLQCQTISDIITLFDFITKPNYIKQYQYFVAGEIAMFKNPPSDNWVIPDGSSYDKRQNTLLYDNLKEKITVTTTLNPNQYIVTNRTKYYQILPNIAIFSPDGLFSSGIISSWDPINNILTIDQIPNQSGSFILEYINICGAQISYIDNNNFFIPNMTAETVIGVNPNNTEYGFFTGANSQTMTSAQMPQTNITYQNNIDGNSSQYANVAANFLTLQYKDANTESILKPSTSDIDIRQLSSSLGNIYIKIY